jgi:hypothetical protein
VRAAAPRACAGGLFSGQRVAGRGDRGRLRCHRSSSGRNVGLACARADSQHIDRWSWALRVRGSAAGAFR